ncbi:hypothetical protein BJY00DRAFT_84350 [Aspergillus carlsbadensis]|nr:hypothetical protein BJY00DRAFT_84350 [Aspergillus carlsbadensis]
MGVNLACSYISQCSNGKHPLAEIQRRSIAGWIPIPTKTAFARCKDKTQKSAEISDQSELEFCSILIIAICQPSASVERLFAPPSLLFFSPAQILLLFASSSSFFALLAVQFVSNFYFYFLPLVVVLQAPFRPCPATLSCVDAVGIMSG